MPTQARRLLCRRAVRDLILSEAHAWAPGRTRKRVSAEILDDIEASLRRHIVAIAAGDFPGRRKARRRTQREMEESSK